MADQRYATIRLVTSDGPFYVTPTGPGAASIKAWLGDHSRELEDGPPGEDWQGAEVTIKMGLEVNGRWWISDVMVAGIASTRFLDGIWDLAYRFKDAIVEHEAANPGVFKAAEPIHFGGTINTVKLNPVAKDPEPEGSYMSRPPML